jgi:predicted phosphoadenosine phosphosulfate sulfurtransferase
MTSGQDSPAYGALRLQQAAGSLPPAGSLELYQLLNQQEWQKWIEHCASVQADAIYQAITTDTP